jgi:hypothetical protein
VIAPSRSASYRRFYLYSALSMAVIAAAVAGAVLLRLALLSAGFGPHRSDADASRTISLAIALLAVALPVGGAHLWLIARSLADPAERAAGVRHQYLNLWLAFAFLVVLFAGQSALSTVGTYDGLDATIQVSMASVAAIVGAIAAWWISRTPPGSPKPRIRTAVVVMLVSMAVAAGAIGTAASGAGGVFQNAGSPMPPMPPIQPGMPVEYQAYQRYSQVQAFRSGLLTAGLALTIWATAFTWQRSWPAARDRLAYALVGYGAGTAAFLVGIPFLIAGAIRYAGDASQISAFTTAWPAVASGALLVTVHATVLLGDRGRNGHPPVTTVRLILAVAALVGLGLVVGGLSLGWHALLERDVVLPRHLAEDLTQAIALLAVGALTYVPSWRAFDRRAPTDSAVRRFYLFTVVCLALVVGLVSGVIVLYNAITSAARVGDADAARTALTWVLPLLVVALLFVGHLRLLLREQRLTRGVERPLSGEPADPLVALLEDVRAGRVSVASAAETIRRPGA